MDQAIDITIKTLEEKKRVTKNGIEFWMARNFQNILGYSNWQNFENVIQKARMACESSGEDPNRHFIDFNKRVPAGSGALMDKTDFYLSRYACYLIAMNGDSTKPEVGTAQAYFAVQTRKQEKQEQLTAEERRIQLRERVRDANRKLNNAAKQAGVQKYAIFHDAGYKGLYEMGLADIKNRKGISPKDDLLDRAGRTELAANEFRITQTEEKLLRNPVTSEEQAISTHKNVGREVRATIQKLGGTMPEDLPAETSIKKLTSGKSEKVKKLPKQETSE